MEALRSVETAGTSRPMARRHNPHVLPSSLSLMFTPQRIYSSYASQGSDKLCESVGVIKGLSGAHYMNAGCSLCGNTTVGS